MRTSPRPSPERRGRQKSALPLNEEARARFSPLRLGEGPGVRLFMAKRFDWIEIGGAYGRGDAEQHAHQRTDQKRQADYPRRNQRSQFRKTRNQTADDRGKQQPDSSAQQRQHHGFRQKLRED